MAELLWTLNTVLTVGHSTVCPLHIMRKEIMPSWSYWVCMSIFPWYRCSYPAWMDSSNLLKCYWKARIRYSRSLGEVGKRSELIWWCKYLIPFAGKGEVKIQFSIIFKRAVEAFWSLYGYVQLFSLGPTSNPADGFICGSSSKGLVHRTCFVV